ncbi:hypothetical protein PIB30_071502 [Stylosanthes scabra]|uniref:Uncharacterized protein n=1 Tax=Stylosanthes scabra TaxID=79078 RepID=A0ABU6UR87_9FABA|nr:hypothetical protein [Stylosanthes scabra]
MFSFATLATIPNLLPSPHDSFFIDFSFYYHHHHTRYLISSASRAKTSNLASLCHQQAHLLPLFRTNRIPPISNGSMEQQWPLGIENGIGKAKEGIGSKGFMKMSQEEENRAPCDHT